MGTLVYAHRGASGYAPENTMSAFIKGIEMGAGGIELDVHLTKDGELVVVHDETVNRTSNGKGCVRDMSLAELRRLDFGSHFSPEFEGERIPTLEEVLDFSAAKKIIVNIEIKATPGMYHPGIEKKVSELVKAFNLEDKVIVSSFNHPCLVRYRGISPEAAIGLLYSGILAETGKYAAMVGAKAVHPNFHSIDTEVIKQCRQHGIMINTWTVNEEKDMERLAKAGIDGIITNYPDIASKVVKGLKGA